jgi:hypothetical protein
MSNNVEDMSFLCTDVALLQFEIDQMEGITPFFHKLTNEYELPSNTILEELTACYNLFKSYAKTLEEKKPLFIEQVFKTFCRAVNAEEQLTSLLQAASSGKLTRRNVTAQRLL